jgi:hypothetical protein
MRGAQCSYKYSFGPKTAGKVRTADSEQMFRLGQGFMPGKLCVVFHNAFDAVDWAGV